MQLAWCRLLVDRDGFLDRPGCGGGRGRRTWPAEAGGSPGHPALDGCLARRRLADVHRPRGRRPRAPRRRGAGRPRRAFRLEPGDPRRRPSTSAGAAATRWSADERPSPPRRTPAFRTKRHGRSASHWPATRSTRYGSPPVYGASPSTPTCGRCGPSSRSPRRSRRASSVTPNGPSSPWRSWPPGRRTPAPTSPSLALLELVEMRLCAGDLAAAGSLFRDARGDRRARARRSRRPRVAGQGRGTGRAGHGRPRRGRALVPSDRRHLLATDVRGQDPSRSRAALRRRRGGRPCGAALRPAPGRARAAAGSRDLGRRSRGGRQVRRDRRRPGRRARHAPDGRRERRAGARARRAGGLAGAGRLDGPPPPCPEARRRASLRGPGVRRGADQPRARRDAPAAQPAHAPRDRRPSSTSPRTR